MLPIGHQVRVLRAVPSVAPSDPLQARNPFLLLNRVDSTWCYSPKWRLVLHFPFRPGTVFGDNELPCPSLRDRSLFPPIGSISFRAKVRNSDCAFFPGLMIFYTLKVCRFARRNLSS